jgi:hypothetical protein
VDVEEAVLNFHPDDFLALSLAVEEEGGDLLADPCLGNIVKLKQPDAAGTMVWRRFHTTHCNQSALMNVTYDPTERILIVDDEESDVLVVDHPGELPQYEEPEAPTYKGSIAPKVAKRHVATVCAVDDAVGLWPRYAGVVSKRSYQT